MPRPRQLRSLRAARMVPVEFVDELPELMPEVLPEVLPEFIELPELVEPDVPIVPDVPVVPVAEPLPMVLPVPVVEPLDDEPEPMLLPDGFVLDGVVPVVDDDGLLGVSVVVVVVVVLPDGVVGVVGVVVVLVPEGVVVVDGLVLDCAMAAPPAISKDAAATAVVVFKNEPMVMTPGVVETKAHRLPHVREIVMGDVSGGGNACAHGTAPGAGAGHELFVDHPWAATEQARRLPCMQCQ